MSLKPLSPAVESQSLSATINVIVNSDNGDDFDNLDDEKPPTIDDQWEQMTVDERAKWRDDNGPGI